MKLKNYTSAVSVAKSASDIEELLVKAGATHVAKFYDGTRLEGFIFQIPVNGMPVTFKLPANPRAVERVMKSEVKKPHRGTMQRISDQAERTAWKLLHDWVHVQISMIVMEQAEAIQIFLPYVYDQQRDQTFFERVKEQQFKLLPGSSTEDKRKERG